MNTQLVQIIEANQLEKTKSQTILDSFSGFFEKASSYEEKANKIIITDISQKEDMKEARKLRLELSRIRCDADKTRQRLKEQSLREGNAIQGIFNIIKALTMPIEQHLEDQEKFIERLEAEEKEKVNQERIGLLNEYVSDTSFYDLKEMSKQGFDQLLESSKIAFIAKREAEEKAESDRLKKEEEDRKEQERIRKENEKLKAEAERREKEIAKEREKAEADRKKQEEVLRKERDEAEAEAERIANEQMVKIKAEIEAREKIEAELKAKNDAEEKSKAEEASRKADQERLDKETRYRDFLKNNGVNDETKHLFVIKTVEDQVRVYKEIAVFNI